MRTHLPGAWLDGRLILIDRKLYDRCDFSNHLGIIDGRDSIFISRQRTVHFFILAHKPVGGPYAVKCQTKISKLLVSPAISIAGCRARMIGCTITFDCQNVPASLLWVLSDKIDSVAGSAALWDQWD